MQRVVAAVEVVAVELYGKASATAVVDGHVPASPDAEVVSLRHYSYQSVVSALAVHFFHYLFEYDSRVVVGVVVHHDNIIFEIRLLA